MSDKPVDVTVTPTENGGCTMSIIEHAPEGIEPTVLTIEFDAAQRRNLLDSLGAAGTGYLRRAGSVA